MKLLWIKTDFLHPTNRGGQIRTLKMLERLHARHEVDYLCLDDGEHAEGARRASEYSRRAIAVPHHPPSKTSPVFGLQLIGSAFSKLPVAVYRYRSEAMRRKVNELTAAENYDSIVCDFLFPAPNVDRLEDCVLFQHNVETMIWRRHAAQAPDPVRRFYFGLEAKKMFAYEREVCRRARGVVAVSEADSQTMQTEFGIEKPPSVPTGVDVEFFARPEAGDFPRHDLVFLGSMDWMPNIDGMRYFLEEVLPLIRSRRPNTSVAIVGRNPSSETKRLAESIPDVLVTGTVDDVRPYLWGGEVSIVPLRIGGGTRLKIYEAMAAGTATVSTSIGAEGLEIHPPDDIRIADEPQTFADQCLALLEDRDAREQVAEAALTLVREQFSWEVVTDQFERAMGW